MAERGILQQAYGQLIPQGMQPNYAAPRTSVEPTPMVGRGEIRPYTFSWRDMARQWLGSIGMSDNTANAVITLADITPVGAAFVGNEARRAVGRGERLAPAAEVALAAAPLPMAAKKAASKAVREVAQEVPTIIAYHGSPRPQFDRFDMSKIGTGEGAQAYGRGLYFAEKEAVAQGYRDDLTAQVTRNADRAAAESSGDLDAAIQAAETEIARLSAMPQSSRRDGMLSIVQQQASELAARKAGQGTSGSMYQVRINANPEDFLDWDKPLSGQSEKVRSSLSALMGPKADQMTGQEVYQKLSAFDPMVEVARKQGASAPDMLPVIFPNASKAEIERAISAASVQKPGDVVASSMLTEKGIPGIKYLDQGSRGAGQGSRNFVVFDDKLINILKRYSWVPGMAIPAAAIQEYTTMYGVAPNLGGQPPID